MWSTLFLKFRLAFLAVLACLVIACGDNNFVPAQTTDTGDSGSDGDQTATENIVQGSVIKGPVNGSIVIVYEFDGITEIGRGESSEDGSFSISIGSNTGGVVISASGGTYTDEATGAENVQFGAIEMRAAYMIPESMTPPFEATINVTPFTELAVREALVDGAIDAQILADVNADFFDLGDSAPNAINILTTIPTNPLTDSVSEGTPEDLYGLYLAMVSQIINDQGLADWEEAVDILEVTENANAILSTALNALASSNTAAGANVTLEAALAALEAVAEETNTGSDGDSDNGSGNDGSGSDGDSAGSGAMPCLTGTGTVATIPSGLAGTAGDLTLSFVAAGSNLTQGTVQNFTFSSSGSLFVDNQMVAGSLYTCSSTELFWYDEAADRTYAVSFTADGSFNEINLNSGDGTFLGQYTDENGDFSNVTNMDSGSGGIDSGSSASGDFTLTITGTVAAATAGVSVAVDIPAVTINNIAAPNANDDFETVIVNSGFNVNGSVTVTTINNTDSRVTFRLQFEGSNSGVDSTYDLTYDYQK